MHKIILTLGDTPTPLSHVCRSITYLASIFVQVITVEFFCSYNQQVKVKTKHPTFLCCHNSIFMLLLHEQNIHKLTVFLLHDVL